MASQPKGGRYVIQIPFDFEFRKTKVWCMGNAPIIGWSKRTDGTVDGSALVAEVATSELTFPVKYPRQNLPEGRWDNLWLEAFSARMSKELFRSGNPRF
jgi:hypothetical protein